MTSMNQHKRGLFVLFDYGPLFILFTNTTFNLPGFEMLTVGTAIFHWLYFGYIC